MVRRLTYRRTTWIVDAHCDDGHSPRSVPHAHGKYYQGVEAKLQVVPFFASR